MEDDPRKFWKRKNPFFDLFAEFDKMDDVREGMMKKAFEDVNSNSGKPMTYGFSVKVGPDVQPQIRQFGNVKPTEQKLEVNDMREPLIDVISRDKEIDVVAELPGVEKKNIDLRFEDGNLIISVPGKFQKKVLLNEKVDENKIDANYKNGVLSITLIKKTPTKTKGKKIEVK